jgi:hypothetical protein
VFKPTPFHVDHDRYYYEPRALWSSASVQSAAPSTSQRPGGFVDLPKEDFKNPSRWPIRLTHAIVSPVGYLYRSIETPNALFYDQSIAGLGRMRMQIAFPKRSWIDRIDTDVMSFANVPTAEPSFDGSPLDYASGLFGTSRWTFPVPYIVPRKASIEIVLSTIQTYTAVGLTPTAVPVRASIGVHERGGRMLGNTRWRAPTLVEYAPVPSPGAGVWPAGPVPVLPDRWGLTQSSPGLQRQVFSPSQAWQASDYNRQLASRGLPYTEITGFCVALDQIDFDDAVAVNGPPGELAPIAQRIITKGRTRDAGTGEQWWRDGAPLALVTPTMTPGFVHRFDDPVMLGPGEGLEVALQAPAPRLVGQTTITPFYNVGVSFCGYAVVEDNNQKVYR